jgi:hypothetical protein
VRTSFRAAVLIALAAVFAAAPARAAQAVDDRPFRALDAPLAAGATVVLEPVSLGDGTGVVLELTRVEPFTRDARIVVHGPDGDSLAPLPQDRWFTGRVVGDPESFVMIARGRSLRGFIATGGRVSTIGPERNPYGDAPQGRTVVSSFDPVLDAPAEVRSFTCGTDTLPAPPEALAPAPAGRRALSSVMYFAGIAVETDFELYVTKGSSATALTQYVGDLFAAVSAIYQRDILVTLQVNYLSIWSTASDPWTATTSSGALSEFVSYWGANRTAVPRSLAHMLSGKGTGGGIAYLSQLCGFAGYGLSGSLSGTAPANITTTYWDFLCASHEIGHNFGSPHTHCYVPPVDICCTCATEGSCGSGTGAGPVPPEKGTIMSYCHQRPGGYGNIKMFLGVPSETSVAVLTRMRTYVETSASCFGIVAGPSVSALVPPTGPTVGGTPVTITGTGFTAPATVKIRGIAAASVVVVNATTITAVTPAGTAGAADVSVIVTGNQGATLVGGYSYSSAGVPTPPPAVSASTGFNTLPPCRLVDTRNAAGPLGGPAIGAGGLRSFVVTSVLCNVPAGAVAISANVTAVNPAAAGDLLVYPNGIVSPPTASTLSLRAGRTRANNSLIYLASDGSFLVKNGGAGALDLLVDVNGYYK